MDWLKSTINTTDKDGWSALHFVADKDFVNGVELLLKWGADPNGTTNEGKTPLMFAIMKGHEEMVRALLKAEVEVDLTLADNDGMTALMFACSFGHTEIVEMLVHHIRWVDITAVNKDGKTALRLAIENGDNTIVKMLLIAFIDQYDNCSINDDTPFMTACRVGHTNVVEMLVRCMSREMINWKNKDGKTALRLASENGHVDVLKLLKKECTSQDELNMALLIASREGHTEIVKVLIPRFSYPRANPDVKDSDGNTALVFAANQGNVEMVRALLEARALEKDKALLLACTFGHTEIVDMLLKADANMNATDPDGNTTLMLACGFRRTEIVEMLIQNGVDVNAETNIGLLRKRALYIARFWGTPEIEEMLRKAGAE